MAAGFPSGTNTFVPQFDASGHIVVNYSRNPKDFALPRYTTLTPVKKGSGYYLSITAEQAARVLQSELQDRIWHDGNDQPNFSWGNESFEFKPFFTQRYAYGFRLGYKSVDQADWKILASHAAIQAQAAMTSRTALVATVLADTSLYDSGHNDTATNWGGGKFDVGTVNTPYFKIGLLSAARKIHQDTLGAVQPKDLLVIMNPNVARDIAASQELMDQFKQSPFAWSWARGEKEIQDAPSNWGLPDVYAGIKIVVEDAVKVTSAKGETKALSYVIPDDEIYMVSRPGGLVGFEGSTSYSSIHVFSYEEMTVETRDDPDNRRHVGRIIDDFDVRMVAPAATVRFSDVQT